MRRAPTDRPLPGRPGPALRSRGARTVVALLAGLAAVGCSGEDSSAQEASVVPSDRSVVVERADRARVLGDTAAPIRVVEVSDFQCPFCARYYRDTFSAIDSLYIQPGKIEYLWISLASANHPRAWPAVEAAFCAGAVGKFWPMHDLLFENQETWAEAESPTETFVGYARQLEIDEPSYRACLTEDRPAVLQVRDLQSVVRAGISGTPFFIVDNSVPIQGAQPLERFRTVIDSVLAARQEGGTGGAPAESDTGSTGGGEETSEGG